MKTLEQETWPFDHAVEEQPSAAVEEASEEKNIVTSEQSKPGFFNKLRQKILPRVWRTA